MLEKDIEKAVCEYAKSRYNAIPYKFTSPGRRNVPDRMTVFPNGKILFIEFKAPGKKPNAGQEREIMRLSARGQTVAVVDDVGRGKALVDIWGDKR